MKFIETKLIERIHSSNLVVNHPVRVGCKTVKCGWCRRVSGSQCVPEDPEMSRQTNKWFMAHPPAAVQQPVQQPVQPADILWSQPAPLAARYLPHSCRHLINHSGQAVSHIYTDFSSQKSRKYH